MTSQKRELLEINKHISIKRQCELLGISRSAYYYIPAKESEFNLKLMKEIDVLYINRPFLGSRRMAEALKNMGNNVNRKRIQRLMRIMGIESIYPKPRLSNKNKEHKIYPYLLSGVKITHPNHVWSTDITYIRMANGFLYLMAIMDWYSRYVLSWRLSNTMEADFCIDALAEALRKYPHPEIFNTDQGSQFTSKEFTDLLKEKDISISMDGKGRAFDNIFIERLWRTVKYEEVYLKDYQDGQEAFFSLRSYLKYYNKERVHQSLSYKTPLKVYNGQVLA